MNTQFPVAFRPAALNFSDFSHEMAELVITHIHPDRDGWGIWVYTQHSSPLYMIFRSGKIEVHQHLIEHNEDVVWYYSSKGELLEGNSVQEVYIPVKLNF